MKTIKASELLKKLENQKKFSKNSRAYQVLLDVINKTNKTNMVKKNKIYHVDLSGGVILDYYADLRILFYLLNLDYSTGNDCTKGSLKGHYFKIKTKIVRD